MTTRNQAIISSAAGLFTLVVLSTMSFTSCCSGESAFCRSYIGSFQCDYSYFNVTYDGGSIPTITLAPFGGHVYSRTSTGSDADYYDELCNLYGDMSYNHYTQKELAGFEWVILPNLVSFDVVCNDDFNETHPKGSSLNDGMSYAAVDIVGFIKNGYVNSTGGNYANGPRKLLCDLTADDLRLQGLTIDLWFVAKPEEIPSTHSVSITLTDENGKTFEYDDIRCDFSRNF